LLPVFQRPCGRGRIEAGTSPWAKHSVFVGGNWLPNPKIARRARNKPGHAVIANFNTIA
jgi:hypothetical protein